ncbi:MAG: glycosyltransferase [Paracoccaceae bacterium]
MQERSGQAEHKVLLLSPFPPASGKAAERGAALAHAFDGVGASVHTLDAPGTSFAAQHIHFAPKRRYRREAAALASPRWALVILAPAALDISRIRAKTRLKTLAVAARHIGLFMRLGSAGKRVLVVRGGPHAASRWLFWAATLCLLAMRPFAVRTTRALRPNVLAARYFANAKASSNAPLDPEDTLVRLAGGGLRLSPAWLQRAMLKSEQDNRLVVRDLFQAAQFYTRHAHAPFQTPPRGRQTQQPPRALDAVLHNADTPLGAMALHLRSTERLQDRFDLSTPKGRARLLGWYVEQGPELAQAALPLPAPLLCAYQGALAKGSCAPGTLVGALQAHLPHIARRMQGPGLGAQLARDFETLLFLSRFTVDLRALAPKLVDYFATPLPGGLLNRFQLLCAVLARMPVADASQMKIPWQSHEISKWFEAHVTAQAPALAVFSTTSAPAAPAGILLTGPEQEGTGIGQNALMSRGALQGITVNRPVALHHVNADAVPVQILRHGTGAHFNIGYMLWEAEQVPFNHHLAADCLDALWAPSRFVADIYARAFDRNVTNLGKAITLPNIPPLPRARFGLGAHHHIVLTAFDAHSSLVRKNPLAALRGFQRAFAGDADARLIIKSTPLPESHWGDPEGQMDAICTAAAADRRIIINTEYLPFAELMGLIASADVLVSSHRAEGFGYLPAYALALGRPVIATDYSGTRDFITPQTGFPVSWQPRTIAPSDTIYPLQAAKWAEIDSDALAATLAAHRADPSTGFARAEQGQKLMESYYSPAALAQRYRTALAELGLLT